MGRSLQGYSLHCLDRVRAMIGRLYGGVDKDGTLELAGQYGCGCGLADRRGLESGPDPSRDGTGFL